MAKQNRKTLAAAVGAAFIVSAGISPSLYAGENPFQMTDLGNGYKVADAHKEGGCGADLDKEGKNTEGKCGENGKDKEGSCGEGKDKEGSCGDEGKEKADGEGKCGEGKCGGDS